MVSAKVALLSPILNQGGHPSKHFASLSSLWRICPLAIYGLTLTTHDVCKGQTESRKSRLIRTSMLKISKARALKIWHKLHVRR